MALHSFHVGGCELQLLSLCKELRKYNIELLVLYSHTRGSQIPSPIEGVKFSAVPWIFQKCRIVPLYLHYLFKWKRGKNPDLFHCHALSPFVEQTLQFAQRRAIPTLVKITTEGEVSSLKKKIQERQSFLSWMAMLFTKSPFAKKKAALENCLFGKHRWRYYSHVDRYISINPNIHRELERFPLEKNTIVSIPNGVDPGRFKPILEEEKRAVKKELGLEVDQNYIVMAARFIERKRFPDLIFAWNQIASHYPQHTLLLIGEGLERPSCEQLVKDLRLSSRVIFTGVRAQMEKYLQAASLFVFTSRLEGLPNVILEAMASSLPIIATSIAGIQEIIEAPKQGILYPPGDREALLRSLRDCLDHPEEGKRRGRAAREKILENYALEKIAPRFISLYEEIVPEK